ncbi:ATP-binding protein [Flammeovirga sp. OC4]|uniref:ATP-binding protein n=1 Tax=Flammeovirga sp. OC4 TaxID=1382345 RepID=UPI0005C4D841|nr:ATP-binding protein [Flammeovirga sp. OC4]
MTAKQFFRKVFGVKNKVIIGGVFMFLSIIIYLVNIEFYSDDKYDSYVQNRIIDLSKNADDAIYEIKQSLKGQKGETIQFKSLLSVDSGPTYIFKKGELVYWSDNNLKLKYIEDKLFNYFVEDVIKKEDSYYYVRKSNILLYNQDYEIFVIVPLLIKSNYQSIILPDYVNKFVFGSKKQPKLAKFKVNSNYRNIKTKLDKYLFSIDVSNRTIVEFFPWQFFLVSVLLAVFFLLSSLSTYITEKILEGYSVFVMLSVFLIGVVLLHQIVLDIISNPLIKDEYKVLEPIRTSFVGSWDSIAVILLDFVFCLLIFRWISKNFKYLFSIRSIIDLDSRVKIGISVFMIIGYFFIINGFKDVFVNVFEIILTYEIELTFFEMNTLIFLSQLIALMGFLMMGLTAHFFMRLICWWLDFYGKSIALLISVLTVFILQFFFEPFDLILINLVAIFIGVSLMIKSPNYYASGRFPAIMYLISHIVLFSTMGAIVIESVQTKKDEAFKQKFALKLMDNDDFVKTLLEKTIAQIEEDNSVIDAMAFLNKPYGIEVSKNIKLELVEWLGNRFDIKVNMLFDNGENVSGEYDHEQLLNSFQENNDSKITLGLNTKMDLQKGTYSYLCNIPIVDKFESTDTLGYCLIELYQKSIGGKYFRSTLLDEDFIIGNSQEDYSYAIFFKGELIFSAGDYNYSNNFLEESFKEGTIYLLSNVKFNGYEHLLLPNTNNRIVVISSKEFNYLNYFKAFSSYFTVLVFIVFFTFNLTNYLRNPLEYSRSFSTKVQIYLNLSIFFPIFLLAIVMGSVMVTTTKMEVERQYLEKAQIVASNLFKNHELSKNYSENETIKLDVFIEELSDIMQADIRFYNKQGILKSASDNEIFDEEILSAEINPQAYVGIVEEKKTRVVLKEQIGTLEYNTSYIGVKAFNTGKVMGIVSIPFFKSLNRLDDRSLEVITTIMMIFTILFLTLLPIVHYAAQGLLSPIKLIIPELNRITLSKKNEPIQYNAHDEFGQLVGEYNKMLAKLEESKKELEQSQRESAWRDVAKQVAHEIKNPLTPMKLYLQQLERVARTDDNPKLMKATKMLINQVDTLSGIVTSFSSFATMPVPKREEFNLSKVIQQTILLHSSKSNIHFSNTQVGADVIVEGDEKLTARILSNLILNGIQAIDDDKKSKIIIDLYENGEKAIVTVIDNGNGIPEDVQNKVFVPNFTTKETGSGIGLAVAKRGIEQMGGSIWFETTEGDGTSFFVEFLMV